MTASMDVMDMNHALATAQALHVPSGWSEGAGQRPRPKSREERMIMSDKERSIYNKLGSSSSPKGKVGRISKAFFACTQDLSNFLFSLPTLC